MVSGAHRVHIPNGISFSSAVFAHLTAESPYIMGRPFHPQNCLFARGIWVPSNTWFLVPTRVGIANGMLIGCAVFVGLTIVTDRPTDHATLVYCNRPHLCSTAMRPNNGFCLPLTSQELQTSISTCTNDVAACTMSSNRLHVNQTKTRLLWSTTSHRRYAPPQQQLRELALTIHHRWKPVGSTGVGCRSGRVDVR